MRLDHVVATDDTTASNGQPAMGHCQSYFNPHAMRRPPRDAAGALQIASEPLRVVQNLRLYAAHARFRTCFVGICALAQGLLSRRV
jgi:hypothetical protein